MFEATKLLLQTIDDNDKPEFKHWQQHGYQSVNQFGCTLPIVYLTYAREADYQILEMILAANVNHQRSNGWTALMHAAQNPTTPLKIFEVLIK